MDQTPIPATRVSLVDGPPLKVFGGETMFYDTQDEVAGAIKHVGTPPNRICHASCYNMVIEVERIAPDRCA